MSDDASKQQAQTYFQAMDDAAHKLEDHFENMTKQFADISSNPQGLIEHPEFFDVDVWKTSAGLVPNFGEAAKQLFESDGIGSQKAAAQKISDPASQALAPAIANMVGFAERHASATASGDEEGAKKAREDGYYDCVGVLSFISKMRETLISKIDPSKFGEKAQGGVTGSLDASKKPMTADQQAQHDKNQQKVDAAKTKLDQLKSQQPGAQQGTSVQDAQKSVNDLQGQIDNVSQAEADRRAQAKAASDAQLATLNAQIEGQQQKLDDVNNGNLPEARKAMGRKVFEDKIAELTQQRDALQQGLPDYTQVDQAWIDQQTQTLYANLASAQQQLDTAQSTPVASADPELADKIAAAEQELKAAQDEVEQYSDGAVQENLERATDLALKVNAGQKISSEDEQFLQEMHDQGHLEYTPAT